MGGKLMALVALAPLPPVEKAVLLAHAFGGQDDGTSCRQGADTLARRSGLSVRTVKRTTPKLYELGLLELEGVDPRYHTTISRVMLGALAELIEHPKDRAQWLRLGGPAASWSQGPVSQGPVSQGHGSPSHPGQTDTGHRVQPPVSRSPATRVTVTPESVVIRTTPAHPNGSPVDNTDPRTVTAVKDAACVRAGEQARVQKVKATTLRNQWRAFPDRTIETWIADTDPDDAPVEVLAEWLMAGGGQWRYREMSERKAKRLEAAT